MAVRKIDRFILHRVDDSYVSLKKSLKNQTWKQIKGNHSPRWQDVIFRKESIKADYVTLEYTAQFNKPKRKQVHFTLKIPIEKWNIFYAKFNLKHDSELPKDDLPCYQDHPVFKYIEKTKGVTSSYGGGLTPINKQAGGLFSKKNK